MRKNRKLLAAFAAFGMLFASSLAVFSATQKADAAGDAGTVKLGAIATPPTNLKNMGPTDARSFTLSSLYDGTLDATGVITITDKGASTTGKMHNSGATGFVLRNGGPTGAIIPFNGGTATINKGDIKKGDKMSQQFTLELGKDAPDTMQGVKTNLEFVFTATQKTK